MSNWYSFVKFQPNFIFFLADLHFNRFPTKQCIYCSQHLLCVSTLPCRNNIVRYLRCLKMKFAHELNGKWQNSVNHTKLYWSVYRQCSICFPQPKNIKFGWDFTSIYHQANGNVQFILGHPVDWWHWTWMSSCVMMLTLTVMNNNDIASKFKAIIRIPFVFGRIDKTPIRCNTSINH